MNSTKPITSVRAMQASVATVWILTGVLVVHPYYRQIGSGYLGRVHLPDWLMYATCAAEVVLGWRVLFGRPSTWLCILQAGMVISFTAILGISDPALLVHRFGILTKNLPLLAVLGTAWLVDREGWSPRARWLLRGGMAVIWVTEGLLPKVFFQNADEIATVAQSGLVSSDPSRFLVFMGITQAVSGIAALILEGRPLRILLWCQVTALVLLPILVSIQDPLLWVHPFAPMWKNVPIIVGTFLLVRRPWEHEK